MLRSSVRRKLSFGLALLPLALAAAGRAQAQAVDLALLTAYRLDGELLLDFDAPHLRPRHDLIANAVHTATGADVTHVLVDGRLLLRDRVLLTLDEERILYEAERRAFRMVNQNMSQMREYQA